MRFLIEIHTFEDVLCKIITLWVDGSEKEVATVERFCEALIKLGYLEIADRIREELQNTPNVVETTEIQPSSTSGSSTLSSLFVGQPPPMGNFQSPQIDLSKLKYVVNIPPQFGNRDDFGPLSFPVRKPSCKTNSMDDDYKLSGKGKGLALILNIIQYQKVNPIKTRNGAQVDSLYLAQLLPQLGYQVVMEDEGIFTTERTKNIVDAFSKRCNDEKPHSIVVYIGGRANVGSLLLSNLKDEMHLYRDIFNKFDRVNCPSLHKRPKVFIVGACREVGGDLKHGSSINSNADYYENNSMDNAIVCYSILEGYFAFQKVSMGTVYAYCWMKVLMEEAHRMHFMEMIKKVHETISQLGTLRTTGEEPIYQTFNFKRFYFNLQE